MSVGPRSNQSTSPLLGVGWQLYTRNYMPFDTWGRDVGDTIFTISVLIYLLIFMKQYSDSTCLSSNLAESISLYYLK